MKRFVVSDPEWGIFLGQCMGLDFWSNLDDVGQDAAVTLTEEEADRFMLVHATRKLSKTELEPDIVDNENDLYASIDACVRAGLPRWVPWRPAIGDA